MNAFRQGGSLRALRATVLVNKNAPAWGRGAIFQYFFDKRTAPEIFDRYFLPLWQLGQWPAGRLAVDSPWTLASGLDSGLQDNRKEH